MRIICKNVIQPGNRLKSWDKLNNLYIKKIEIPEKKW